MTFAAVHSLVYHSTKIHDAACRCAERHKAAVVEQLKATTVVEAKAEVIANNVTERRVKVARCAKEGI